MKILIFGSTGMLGRYVYNILKNNYSVICINRNNFDIENDEWYKLEHILFENLKENDIIINCAGIIPQKYKNENLKIYIRVNTVFPHKLNEITKKLKCKFIHITTDCVFDGSKGNYSINDIHSAKDIYGISKSEGEPEDATVIRTSIIGEEIYGKKSLIEWVKSNKDGKIKGYTNHYWNGVTCLTLANFIKSIIDNKNFWKGIKHICSENIVTKYDLCCFINEIYKLNINIEKYEDLISKNMTLVSTDNLYTDDIYKQVINLHEFRLNF
jgi:dTDP-4-dehydrorhamnose reductase